MELSVLGAVGMPKNGVISIRVGGTRRQVQLGAIDKPLKFPCRPEEISNVKVDVLSPVAGARLPFDPAAQKYTLELDPVSNDDTRFSTCSTESIEVSFEVKRVDQVDQTFLGDPDHAKEDDTNAYRHRREVEAHGYLEEHGLLNFMQYLLHSLMQDKPSDPYGFLKKQVDMKTLQQEVSRACSGGYPSEAASKAAQPPRAPISLVPIDSQTSQVAAQAAAQVLQVKPADQDIKGLSNLLGRLTPRAASSIGAEDLMDLERQAIEASQRLRDDNARLCETVTALKSEYEKLMQESTELQRIKKRKETGRATGALLPFARYYKSHIMPQANSAFQFQLYANFPRHSGALKAEQNLLAPPPPRKKAPSEASAAAWREVETLQGEVRTVAEENARLVAELAHMRSLMATVRTDIEEMSSSLDALEPTSPTSQAAG